MTTKQLKDRQDAIQLEIERVIALPNEEYDKLYDYYLSLINEDEHLGRERIERMQRKLAYLAGSKLFS